MNDKELVLYRNILTKMKEHKRIYSYLYNNKNYEFISKKDINVSNNVIKGVILFKINSKYLVDIYIGNGIDSIITGLLFKKYDSLEDAKNAYADYIEYVNTNDILTILKNGEKNYKID